MVHIEEVFAAFNRFVHKQNAIRMDSARNPEKWKREMAGATDEFRAFCEEHDLAIDFTPRED